MPNEALVALLGAILGIVATLIGGLGPWHWLRRKLHIPPAKPRPVLVRKARYAGIANFALLIEGILISFAAAASLYG